MAVADGRPLSIDLPHVFDITHLKSILDSLVWYYISFDPTIGTYNYFKTLGVSVCMHYWTSPPPHECLLRALRLTWPKHDAKLPHATFSDFLSDVKRSAFVGLWLVASQRNS